MRIYRVATANVAEETLSQWETDGRIPPVATIPDFSPLETYRRVLQLPETSRTIGV
jgi:hypothetical protein